MQRQDEDEVEKRMTQLERDHITFLQSRSQNVLRGILDALNQAPIGRHAARKHDSRFVGAELRLKADQFKPAHPCACASDHRLAASEARELGEINAYHLKSTPARTRSKALPKCTTEDPGGFPNALLPLVPDAEMSSVVPPRST